MRPDLDNHAANGKEKEVTMSRCRNCGGSAFQRQILDKYHYRECGLKNVWLHGGVFEFTCKSCGTRYIAVFRESQLLQVIALSLVTRPRWLRGSELRYLRRACGLTQQALADKLEVQRPTLVGWESGGVERLEKPRILHLRMVLLKEFLRALSEEGNNHLADEHRRRIEEFSKRFTGQFERYFARRTPVLIELQRKDDLWEPLPAAA